MTLNYIGSKKSLLKFIDHVIQDQKIKIKPTTIIGDLFAGTNIVSKFMYETYKCKIISNDLEKYSYILGNGYLKANYTIKMKKYIKLLNDIEPVEGLIYKNYSPGGVKKRKFWTIDNAQKIDGIRLGIKNLYENKKIIEREHNFLLASLLLSADKVANVASVYGAYLKKFKPSAENDLVLKPIHTNNNGRGIIKHIILNKDIMEVDNKLDITYLDPPYNNRQYSANYFPLNYIVEYDENIKLRGKTGIIENNNISKFCQKSQVLHEFMKLINNLDSKHILLSYNDEGLLTHEDIKLVLNGYGYVKLYKARYKKFINSKKENISENEKKKVYEYIFYLKKNQYDYDEEEIDLSSLS